MPVLKWILKLLVLGKEKVWDFFDGFNDDELYVIDKVHVIKKYLEFKVDEIEEFATVYTYEQHEIMGKLNDRESKEKMYIEVYEILAHLKRKGSLDN